MASSKEDFTGLEYDLQRVVEKFRSSVYLGGGSADVCEAAFAATLDETAYRINDSVYELYRPDSGAGKVDLEIVFFHGLRLGTYHSNRSAHVTTWMSSSEPSECWIKTWLPQHFPRCRILTASYDSSGIAIDTGSCFDLHLIAETLAQDIILGAKVGQQLGTPVILVGHCIGGLVIKKLCLHVGQNLSSLDKEARERFVENMTGIFFFATPQIGMKLKHLNEPGPLAESVQVLGKSTARLNETFEDLRKFYSWALHGVGESQPTRLRELQGLLEEDVLMVEEASCRPYLDEFMCLRGADHFSVCRPQDMKSSSFCALVRFLEMILVKAKSKNPEPFPQQLPEELVGLEKRLSQLKTILFEGDDILEVNICGMGGIGKTTIAKALFNELCVSESFDYTTFIESSSYNDYFSLETVVKHHLYYKGMKVSGSRTPINISSKKILFILDDVHDRCSVNEPTDLWFKLVDKSEQDDSRIDVSGSRLVVTSRERDVLRNSKRAHIFDMSLLDEKESYELLVKHAFPRGSTVPENISDLVKAVARKCDGLPLTLEVIGISLSGIKDREEWTFCLEKLEAAGLSDDPIDVRLWKTLKVSYDGLNAPLKQMFLDAATIFNGVPLYLAQASWSSTFNIVSSKIPWKHLIGKSLVYGSMEEGDTGVIRMHEQLRSLGRFIAGSEEEKSRCRIWKSDDAWEVLTARSDDDHDSTSDEKLKNIHALRFHFSELDHDIRTDLPIMTSKETQIPSVSPDGKVVRIPSKPFCKMTNLKYLLLDGVDIAGSDKKSPFSMNLVMLIWSSGGKSSQLPIPSSPGVRSQLAVLHLLFARLGSLDRLVNKRFPNLKVVELRSAKEMENVSDNIGIFANLERLSFYWCPRLREIPSSVGNWERLEELVFWDCPNLHTLPELAKLSKLKRLILYRCSSLKRLPKSIGKLTSLRILDLHRCSNLEELPESIRNLSRLQSLSISGKFQELPNSFGESFLALRNLKFKYCENLRSLPANTFKSCSNLEKLTVLRCSKLQALPSPEVFEGLKNLKNVLIGWVAVSREHLEELKTAWSRHNIIFNVRGYNGPNVAYCGWREDDTDAISVDDDHLLQEKEIEESDEPVTRNCSHQLSECRCMPSSSKTCTHRHVKGENLQHRYLALQSVHESLQRITVEVESHDQGYSSYFWAHGTELCAHSFCELSVRTKHSPEGEELARVVLFFNLHAVDEWQTHRCIVDDKELLALVKPGHVVEVTLRSQWLAWETYAKSGSLELVPADDHGSAESLEQGVNEVEDSDGTTRPVIKSYMCQNIPRRLRVLKGEYVRIACRWAKLKKIYVEFDSMLLIPEGNEPCYNNTWGPICFDMRRSSWRCSPHRAEIGVIGKDGSEVGERISVSSNMYTGFGWQRHTYLVEDESFLKRIDEGCFVILWITVDVDYPNRVCWIVHFQIRHAQMHLIPELDNFLPQHVNTIFPHVLGKVETFQKLTRGRCLNWMYLAYQNPFVALKQIDVVVEAHECALGSASIDLDLVSWIRNWLSSISLEELHLVIKIVKARAAELNEIMGNLSTTLSSNILSASGLDTRSREEGHAPYTGSDQTRESEGDEAEMLMTVSRSAESDSLPRSPVPETGTADEGDPQSSVTSEPQFPETHLMISQLHEDLRVLASERIRALHRAQAHGDLLTWENLRRCLTREGLQPDGTLESLIRYMCHEYMQNLFFMVDMVGKNLTWDELSLLINIQQGDQVAERDQCSNQTGKGSTWGELGLLTQEGDQVGERLVVFSNPHYHQSTAWERHEFTVSERDHQTFLNRIKEGYRVVLWLRSGPGWIEEQLGEVQARSRLESYLDRPCLPGFARTAMRHISRLTRCLPPREEQSNTSDPAALSARYASIKLVPKV